LETCDTAVQDDRTFHMGLAAWDPSYSRSGVDRNLILATPFKHKVQTIT
jgi:hypothetical protein